MSGLFPLGAVNSKTGQYVFPASASKDQKYICPECQSDLVIVKGDKRVHHFRHKAERNQTCHYYEHPSESQIHKDAKLCLKSLLENKNISLQFSRKCRKCQRRFQVHPPDFQEGSDEICLEYRFQFKQGDHSIRIADVAHISFQPSLGSRKIKIIYEICHTHKTNNDHRPEPWVEIDAKSLQRYASSSKLTENIFLECIRNDVFCDTCQNKIKRIKSIITLEKASLQLPGGDYHHWRYCVLCARNIKYCGGYSDRYHLFFCYYSQDDLEDEYGCFYTKDDPKSMTTTSNFAIGICDPCHDRTGGDLDTGTIIEFPFDNRKYNVMDYCRANS